MQEKRMSGERYDVDIVEMVRNNNIAIGWDCAKGYDTYFMLDYFDLLFHKNLKGKDKIYRAFWNIKENKKEKELNYKAAYKTLSIYAKIGEENNFFSVDAKAGCLSERPFLGIIQINFVHYIYKNNIDVEDILAVCEQKITEALEQNVSSENVKYLLYRSSTSGDFCLAVKSDKVENIFKISTMLNNFVVEYREDSYKFNTYTNTGIECTVDSNGKFCSFREDTIEKNMRCQFAIRITAYNDIAFRIHKKIEKSNEISVKVEPMDGLFGRYDFLLHLTMKDFSKLYSTLCKSKIVGCKVENSDPTNDESLSFIELLQLGIEEGKIRIINERVLVPLSDVLFNLNGVEFNSTQFTEKDKDLKNVVREVSDELKEKVKQFQKMEYLFVEERRCFIDISRELWEVLSTYVPQGMENDSHVNWQILISDLRVTFEAIKQWKKSYEACGDKADAKDMRGLFLENLRLITDAINQYYKFLQNVNSQTWQSPLYEIQTQLDAEKMMIAYREFLYEYFQHYKKSYDGSGDQRPLFYPIVYPDASIEKACVVVAFMNERDLFKRLLICRIPSFEYYGRVFDMIPWILHEASHYIRTMERAERNKYVIELVIEAVFSQAIYKLLNRYSNDFGYHGIGMLESEILNCITMVVVEEFDNFCKDDKQDIAQLGINFLETELIQFLHIIFDKRIYQMNIEEDARNIQAIQQSLFRFLGSLGLFESAEYNVIDMVQGCVDKEDDLSTILKSIHDTVYRNMTGCEPKENIWDMVRKDSWVMEMELKNNCKDLGAMGVPEEQLRDYCFTVRELNRLYGAWNKRQKEEVDSGIREHLWETCIYQIRTILQEGFDNNKGFTELYRIFNMIFGVGTEVNEGEVKRVETEFNILMQEELHELVEREITIYRESYADIFMAAALGLTAFGYCRQMFQMASDATVENSTKWAEGINVHRFRVVAAVLLGQDTACEEKVVEGNRYISMDKLLQEGKKYCVASLKCAESWVLSENSEKLDETKKKDIGKFFKMLVKNIEYIFGCFGCGVPMKEVMSYSILELCLNPEKSIDLDSIKDARDEVSKRYNLIQEYMECCKHVLYRIQCFIIILSMMGENRCIIIKDKEYRHLQDLYKAHLEKCQNMWEDNTCKVVADYYNNPSSAFEKKAEEMLEDTIQFIQTYYYKNRFEIMLSE